MKLLDEDWVSNASDEELYEVREPHRIKAVYDGDEDSWDTMLQIDDELIVRMNARYEAEHPNSEPRHREHGWYLPNDD